MQRLTAPHARPRALALLVVLVGTLAAVLMAACELNRFEAGLADERTYQMREVQEGLSALHRDLQMIDHLATLSTGSQAQDFVAARRDQLAAVHWLGHVRGPDERPEVLLASVETRSYDPRRDAAVAALLSTASENSLAAAIPGSHRNSATLALVFGPTGADGAALVALVDGNQMLDDSLNALNHATAPFDLRLEGHSVGRWPRFNQHDRGLTIAESRPISVGPVELTLEFAAAGTTTVAGRVLALPLLVLVSALLIAALAATGDSRRRRGEGEDGNEGECEGAPPAPPPAAAAYELHRTRLWQLGELAATLSHDLGQPLNVIRLTAEATQDAHERGRLDGPRLTRSLGNAVDQALRAQAMIDGLVSVTRRPRNPPTQLHPVAVVRRVLARNLERLKGQGVRLRWHAELPVPPVLGHAVRLEAAVQHLLTNACEALTARPAECGDAGTVWVACRREGDCIAIEVADDGPGFPPELLPLLDDPLAAAPGRSKGCGLGLAVILGVAAEMGGRLAIAERRPGTWQPGTCATLLLPAAERSLLLVEDDDAAAEALAGHLGSRGWRVRVAHGGNPALAMFKDQPADAVVTDLHMADGDGWQLIARLRALSPDTPIIAVSTSDGEAARHAVTCGAALVLRKPLGLQDVCDELEGLFADAD